MRLNRNFLRKLKAILEARAVVLMYHRIDNVTFDPWQLAVSPENFEQQLKVLNNAYNVVPLNGLKSRLNKKPIGSKYVCITFDDGYVDNYIHAKPLLEKYNCPATFFIAHNYIGTQRQYWWDELQDLILTPEKLPQSISMSINDKPFFFKLPNDGRITKEEWNKQRDWYYELGPATHRCELYLKLWEQLKPLPYGEIELMMRRIREWTAANIAPDRNSFPMSGEQLDELTHHSLIDLGIHTMTHLSLSAHNTAIQEKEIVGNRQFLEAKCGKEINTIAYPYGDYNEATLGVVSRQSIDIAVTTEERPVTYKAKPHQFGRFQVKNWNGEDFEKYLRMWFGS